MSYQPVSKRYPSTPRVVLLCVAVLAPFTALRFSFFGFAELLILLLFLGQLMKPVRVRELKNFHLTKFWLIYLVISMIGWAINWMVLDYKTGLPEEMLFDFASYLFILFACFAMERLATHGRMDMDRFIRDLFFYSTTVLSALYALSFFTPTLMGLPLKYYDFFVPLADNLHQVSMFLVTLPFLGIAAYKFERSRVRRALIFPLSLLAVVMSVATGSTKASMAVVAGALALAYAFSVSRLGPRKAVVVGLAFAILSLPALVYLDALSYARAFFVEADGGGAREYLYGEAIVLGTDSIVFGRGPGPHIDFLGDRSFSDAHNTFLTAYLQAGVLGLLALVFLFFKGFRLVHMHPPLVGAFVAILIYAAGGDILRRLPIWIVLFAIVHFSISLRRFQAEPQVAPGPVNVSDALRGTR